MTKGTLAALATASILAFGVSPASASVYSGDHRLSAHRLPATCHGDLTERSVLLVNDAPRSHRFRVQTVIRNADGSVASTDDYRERVPGGTDAQQSVYLAPGQTARILVTHSGEVLFYRAVRSVCW